MGRLTKAVWKIQKPKLRIKISPKQVVVRNAVNLFLVGVLSLNMLGMGLPALMANYNDQQQRIPRPLANNVAPDSLPAVDVKLPGGKLEKLPEDLDAQLSDDLKKEREGKKDTRRVKLLNESRTEHDKLYLNADGSRSLEHSFQATSFKDKEGIWKDVDTTLEEDQPMGKWRTKANSWEASFGDIADGVQLTKDGQVFTFRPVEGKSIKPTITGQAPKQVVTYRNVWQGVDIQYEVAGSQVKESIIVKSKAAASSFDFDVSGVSLAPNPSQAGSFLLDGAFEGFIVAAPTVMTAEKESISAAPVITQTLQSSRLHVELDAGWLKSQDAKAFPVTIDPTIFKPVGGSSFHNFRSDGFTCDVGCGQRIGRESGGLSWRFAYQVSYTEVSGFYPVWADLSLDLRSGATASKPIKVNHASCTNAYACFDNLYGESSDSIADFGDVDVSAVYQNAAGANDFSSWMMVRGDESTNGTLKEFDETLTAVTINYEKLPSQSLTTNASPADGGAAITTQPTLFSTTNITDSDGPGPNLFRYTIGTSKNTPASNPFNVIPGIAGAIADSGQSASAQWTVPDNVLQDGKTYYWQASVWDSYSGAPEVWSPVYSFRVDLRNGKDTTQAFDELGPVSTDLATGNLTTSAKSHSVVALGGSLGVGLDYNSPQRSRQGLVGQYWNDPSGTKTFPASNIAPAVQRIDPNINFDWGAGSPYTGLITGDNFLARWTGYFTAPQAGTFQFGTTSDNGSRIYVNGVLSQDSWNATPTGAYGAGVTLTAGQAVEIKYELNETTGNAKAQFLVKTTDGSIAPTVIQPAWLQTGVRPIATPHGLVGRYYTDPGAAHTFPANADDPSRLFLTRTDTTLTQNWGAGAPVPNGPTDNFIIRWTGYFTAPTTDTYTLGAGSDDGVRVYVDNSPTPIVNAWSDHGPSPVVWAGSGITMTAGQIKPITVEYYENGGSAQMNLYAKRASQPFLSDPSPYLVESNSLSPRPQELPDGWEMSIDGDDELSYDYAVISQASVILHDSMGQTHEYKFTNGGFTPPVNESGHMIRNGDGTVTLQDADGRTYLFNVDGSIKSATTPTDDRNPTALQYTYGGEGVHLRQITDSVNTSRWAKIYVGGDKIDWNPANADACPTPPAGFAATPPNLICAVATSDGRTSKFYYTYDANNIPRLARLEQPGGEITDYGYDATLGRIVSLRDSLANDAIAAGVRTQDSTVLTEISYDALGRVNTVTMPAATAGATRLAHIYEYQSLASYTNLHVANATEPNGFTRKVVYDATYRTTEDRDIANLATTTQWHAAKDLVLSTTDPAGLKSTTLYDYADRATDLYGPAPSAWFGTDGQPLTTPTNYTSQVPHAQTGYDENINGLAAAYYNVTTASNGTGTTTKLLFGSPKLHTTGVGPSNGDVVKNWGATPPITPPTGQGWGTRLSGLMRFGANGTYTLKVKSDDGVRLWIDDQLVVNDWTDGAYRTHATGTYNSSCSPADCWKRVQLDYYNKAGDTDAQLELLRTSPGGSETNALGNLLSPGYGLTTTEKTFDSSTSVGDTITTTGYGTNPELGLKHTSTVDPTGLNYTTANTYETQGTSGSFLRQLTKTLPGGNTTNYAYYTATDTKDDPCTTGTTEAYKQAGMLKTKTEPDPDGAGTQTSRTTETIYDDAGRPVAARYNQETSWTCNTYDARGRVAQVSIPSQPTSTHTNLAKPARTVINNWAVGGNPLVASIGDSQGTITTTVDLLGRTATYVDAKGNSTSYSYDTIGRLTSKTSPAGTEGLNYDNLSRVTAQQLNTTTLASPSYDSFGRLQGVTYPTAGALTLTLSRDNLGRINSRDYTVTDPSTLTTVHRVDTNTLSQAGMVVSGTEAGAAKTYTYDKAGRLTNATLGSNSFSYSFSTPAGCSGTYSANSGKNANRTSSTEVVNGTTTTNTYCYDHADRLISSTSNGWPMPGVYQYDTHGNLLQSSYDGQNHRTLDYDSSDRAVYMSDMGGTHELTRDAQDRVLHLSDQWQSDFGYTGPDDTPDFSRGNTGYVQETFIRLPGDVLATSNLSFNGSVTSRKFSLPNLHGDIFVTTNDAGELTGGSGYPNYGTFQYDPFGKVLATSTPENMYGSTFAGFGQHGRITADGTRDDFVFMGARLYSPVLGRFTQVDPVEGGGENNYVYPSDPVNDEDITGECVSRLQALCASAAGLASKAGGIYKAAQLSYRAYQARKNIQLSQKALDHIVLRHWATSGPSNVGKFAKGTTARQLRSMILQAARKGRAKAGHSNRIVFEYDFGRIIGRKGSGKITSKLRVVLENNGTVETAFPF